MIEQHNEISWKSFVSFPQSSNAKNVPQFFFHQTNSSKMLLKILLFIKSFYIWFIILLLSLKITQKNLPASRELWLLQNCDLRKNWIQYIFSRLAFKVLFLEFNFSNIISICLYLYVYIWKDHRPLWLTNAASVGISRIEHLVIVWHCGCSFHFVTGCEASKSQTTNNLHNHCQLYNSQV